MGLWSNIQKHLFSGSSSAETLFRQKQLIPATFYLKSISLLLISATLISALYLSTIPWFMSAVGNETSEPEISYCLWWKLFCYSSPSHLIPETFVSPSALCLSFIFSFLCSDLKTTTANLQGLTHPNPSKSTNQVTLSNKHMNHLFWV